MDLDRLKRKSRQVHFHLFLVQDANKLIEFSLIICNRKLEAKLFLRKTESNTLTRMIRHLFVAAFSIPIVMIRVLLFYNSEC